MRCGILVKMLAILMFVCAVGGIYCFYTTPSLSATIYDVVIAAAAHGEYLDYTPFNPSKALYVMGTMLMALQVIHCIRIAAKALVMSVSLGKRSTQMKKSPGFSPKEMRKHLHDKSKAERERAKAQKESVKRSPFTPRQMRKNLHEKLRAKLAANIAKAADEKAQKEQVESVKSAFRGLPPPPWHPYWDFFGGWNGAVRRGMIPHGPYPRWADAAKVLKNKGPFTASEMRRHLHAKGRLQRATKNMAANRE